MSDRAEEHPVFRMALQDVSALVAELEERYRTWTLPHVAPTGVVLYPQAPGRSCRDSRQSAAQCGASGPAARGVGPGAGGD